MKALKKIIISLLTFLLMDLLSVLMFSLTAQDVIINDILKIGLNNNIIDSVEDINVENEEINNIVEDELPLDKEMFNEILETEEMKELMNDFINNMINELSKEGAEVENLQVDKKLINYLKDHKEAISDKIGVEITDEMLDETEQKLEESHIGEVIDKSVKNTKKQLTRREKYTLKLFRIANKTSTRLFILIAILIVTVLIAIIEKSIYKWIKNLSYAMAVSGAVTVISGFSVLYVISSKIPEAHFDVSPMTNLGLICFIFGIVISIIYFIFKKYIIKDDANEISQVSK